MSATRQCPRCLSNFCAFERTKIRIGDGTEDDPVREYEIEVLRTGFTLSASALKRSVMNEVYTDFRYPEPFAREPIRGPQRRFTCPKETCQFSELVYDHERAKELGPGAAEAK